MLLRNFFIIAGISLLTVNCQKDPTPVSLPDEVNLGESVVYLNGDLVSNYEPVFQYLEFNKVMSYGFSDAMGDIVNSFGFDNLPLSTGNFKLTTQRNSTVEAFTNFNQFVSEDLDGYSYKLIDRDEGFFNVESMDTVQQIVKGRFLAKFKRTSKNGNKDLGLSKILLFQGVFHEKYVKI